MYIVNTNITPACKLKYFHFAIKSIIDNISQPKIGLWWLLFVARVTWRNCHARCADWRRTRRGRPRSSTSSCRRTRSAASFSLSAWTASRRWRPELPVDHRPPRFALPHVLRRWHANSHSLGTDWNTYFWNHMINKTIVETNRDWYPLW